MRFNIISDSNRRIPRKKIIELLKLIEEDEEPPASGVNIVFTRDSQIKKLNKQYRGQDKATDVLSFNIDDEAGEDAVLGEIYISTDTAAVNAERFGRTFSQEILILTCHGFLHLLGYDHIRDKDFAKMQAREKKYLGMIGL